MPDVPGDQERAPRGWARSIVVIVAVGAGVCIGVAAAWLVWGRSTGAPIAVGTPAGRVDVGFATDMLDHHAQAVLLADHVVAHGVDPTVKVVAYNVVSSQRYEMGALEQFLEDHGARRPTGSDRTAMGWMGTPVPGAQMAGMLSQDEVNRILNTTGPELDALFVDAMIRHHEGAVHMADYALDKGESQAMRSFAGRVRNAQQREINELRALQGG